MQGKLTAGGLPTVPVTVGATTVDAVVDTGFDGHLQLPDTLAGATPRVFYRVERFVFPDGSWADFEVYVIGVEFDGGDVITRAVYTPSSESLIGHRFLTDYRLTIDYPAGTVPLDRTRP